MNTTLRLLVDWEGYTAQSLVRVDKTTADELIAAKTAELYDPESERLAAERIATDQAAKAAEIKQLVAAEVTALSKIDSGFLAHTHERFLDDPKGGFKSFGEHAIAVRDANAGQMDPRLKAASGLNENIDADGGFLVPTEFRAELLQKTYDSALVMGRCRQLPVSTNSIDIPFVNETSRANGSRSGGIRAYWLAEAASKSASKPAFGKIHLKLDKLAAFVYATDELMTDSVITLESLLSQMVADEFAFVLDDGIIEGTGAGMPLGILNAPALVTADAEGGQLADTIVSENILNMWSRLYSRGRSNSVWFINQDIEPQLQAMTLGAGASPQVVYMPPGGLSAAPYATLMGRPVIAIEQCSTLGDKGDIILADMSQYIVGTKVPAMESAVSIHYRFIYDETCFRFVMRVDGQPWWASALIPFKGSATQSPFVTLAARA